MNNHEVLDSKLQQLYRQLPQEQPSPELDAKIINAAQFSVRAKKTWQQPFALAATLTLTTSLIWYWQAEQPLQLERAVSVAKEQSPVAAPLPERSPIESSHQSDEVVLQSSRKEMTVIASNIAKLSQQKAKQMNELDGLSSKKMDDNKISGVAKSDKDVKANVVEEQKQAVAAPSLTKNAPTPMIAEVLPESVSVPIATIKPSASAQGAAMADRMEARASSAGAIAPQGQLAVSKKAKEEGQVFSATIEGAAIGMRQAQLLTLGFNCQNDVCQKTINRPSQARYWGMSATNAQLSAFIRQHTVNQLVLAQPQASLEEITQQIEQLGEPTERDCTLQQGVEKAQSQRVVDGYLLQVRQQGSVVTVSICLAQ